MAAIDCIFTSEHTTRPATPSETFAANPADVLNALGEQRNDVAILIGRASDLSELRAAEKVFHTVAVLWHALGYGYKAAEVRARIVARAGELANVARAYGASQPRTMAGIKARGRAAFDAEALEAYAENL